MKINIKNIRVKSICATLFISLFLSCNNGIEELQKQRDSILSISNLRQGFLDIFTSFGDMLGGVLGIKADTKKEAIGKYFTDIADTIEKVKEKLSKVEVEYGKYPNVKTAVDKCIATLDKIVEGAKIAAGGATGSGTIGNVEQNQDANPADVTSVNALVKGIKTIIGIVFKQDEGKSDANVTDKNHNKTVGKLFNDKTNGAGEAEAAAASASIGAITGADILQAIAISKDAASGNKIETATNAAEIAAATMQLADKNIDIVDAQKDAVIAAGIALRAMAKGGKFSAKNDVKYVNAVKGAASSAVNKTLSTLIIAIRNTVDSGLKTISEALAAVKQGDVSSETSESGADK